MKYQVKENPRNIGFLITHEFTLIDEDGNDLKLRKWENEHEGGLYLYDENEKDWVDYYNIELEEQLDDLFYDYEWLKI